jgi:hypothetical protein
MGPAAEQYNFNIINTTNSFHLWLVLDLGSLLRVIGHFRMVDVVVLPLLNQIVVGKPMDEKSNTWIVADGPHLNDLDRSCKLHNRLLPDHHPERGSRYI